jgi:hypothetical protein
MTDDSGARANDFKMTVILRSSVPELCINEWKSFRLIDKPETSRIPLASKFMAVSLFDEISSLSFASP